ncbi:MAG: hypothetical protein ACRC1H_04900 [Caldilineaceae bacterium]
MKTPWWQRVWRQWPTTLLIVALALGAPRLAAAQDPQRSEAFVYALTAFDGQIFQSTFAPPTSDTIFLLANSDNVISPRNTQLYYWNLSNRYEADWRVQNEDVAGTLEILEGNQLVASLPLVPYVMQIDESRTEKAGRLYTDGDAQSAYTRYVNLRDAYRAALFAYASEYQDYRAQVDDIMAKRGTQILSADAFPVPPAPVPPFRLFSTEMSYGHVVNLPAGRYTVHLRMDDGSVLGGSERAVEVFAPLQQGVSYTVLPGARWTMPALTRTANSALYSLPGESLYLQPFAQVLYNDYQYAHLLDPQDESSRRDRVRWVSYQPLEELVLDIEQDGVRQQLVSSDYKVIQLAGSGLGYEVRELDADAGDEPSFAGYLMALDDADGAAEVRLVDRNGQEILGSVRQVRALNRGKEWVLYLLAVAPLVIGAAVVSRRRGRAQRVRLAEEPVLQRS